MKIQVLIKLKPEVLDPAGETVRKAAANLGFEGIEQLRIGKVIDLVLDDKSSKKRITKAEAKRLAQKLCEELLANPVIETCEIGC